MAHAAAAFGSLLSRRADAGLPADLGATGPELMAERAEFGLVFENGYRHGNDHALAGGVSVLSVLDRVSPGMAGFAWMLSPGRPSTACAPVVLLGVRV